MILLIVRHYQPNVLSNVEITLNLKEIGIFTKVFSLQKMLRMFAMNKKYKKLFLPKSNVNCKKILFHICRFSQFFLSNF